MIRKFYILTLFLTISYIGFAKTIHSTRDSIKKTKKFYIIEFEGKPPITTRYLILDPKKIAHLNSMSDASDAEFSKLLNVDFVLVVKFVPHTKLLTLNELLTSYKINIADWDLPVTVDDEKIDYPQTMLISRNQINKVSIVKGPQGRYIRIIRI